jgi:hypothetical protein
MKLKVLGAAFLAFAATSAFAVTHVSATTAGHFTHEGATNNTIITGHEHQLEFIRLAAGTYNTTGEPIICNTSQYTGKVEAKTVTSIQMFPKYTDCTTTSSGVTVFQNHCSYTFSSQGAGKHGTVVIDCPAGKAIEITTPGCVTRVPAQTTASTLTEGVSYKTVAEGKLALTAEVTVNTITVHFESGICVFLGTAHKFEMKGSVTVKGYDYVSGNATEHTLVEGAQIPITST